MANCFNCGAGLHEECHAITEGQCCCGPDTEDDEEAPRKLGKRGRRNDNSLKDPQSTGRKRAAVLYPLDENENCEWKGLKFAGGGKYPIVGCYEGKQQARHHGPDKNTLNNDEGNVHRICDKCHNRWHAKNNDGYEWGEIHQSHDPDTLATAEELVDSEMQWLGKKLKKIED